MTLATAAMEAGVALGPARHVVKVVAGKTAENSPRHVVKVFAGKTTARFVSISCFVPT
jgi:hypothetical protein